MVIGILSVIDGVDPRDRAKKLDPLHYIVRLTSSYHPKMTREREGDGEGNGEGEGDGEGGGGGGETFS